METVFKVPKLKMADVGAYTSLLRKHYNCPIAVYIGQECNGSEFVNYFALLSDEELEQMEQEWDKERLVESP